MDSLIFYHRLMQSSNNTSTTSDGGGKARHVVIILSAGIAVVAGMVLLTYLSSIVADCFLRGRGEVTPDDMDRGSLSRKANLWGLRLHERARVLPHIFQKTTFAYSESMVKERLRLKSTVPEKPLGAEVGDIEMGAVASGNYTHGTRFAVPAVEKRVLEKNEGVALDSEHGVVSEDGEVISTHEAEAAMDSTVNKVVKENNLSVSTTATSPDVAVVGGIVGAPNIDAMPEELNDADHHRMCCICLASYDEGVAVMTGTQCDHMFHQSCCQEWLLKHDHCPYCRKEMMLATEFRQVAVTVLGARRVDDLSMVIREAQSPPHREDPVRHPRWWRHDVAAPVLGPPTGESVVQGVSGDASNCDGDADSSEAQIEGAAENIADVSNANGTRRDPSRFCAVAAASKNENVEVVECQAKIQESRATLSDGGASDLIATQPTKGATGDNLVTI